MRNKCYYCMRIHRSEVKSVRSKCETCRRCRFWKQAGNGFRHCCRVNGHILVKNVLEESKAVSSISTIIILAGCSVCRGIVAIHWFTSSNYTKDARLLCKWSFQLLSRQSSDHPDASQQSNGRYLHFFAKFVFQKFYSPVSWFLTCGLWKQVVFEFSRRKEVLILILRVQLTCY